MSRTSIASTFLTVGAALNTWATPSLAQSRCEADLSRVQNEFCLNDQHLAGAPQTLKYDWSLDDQSFDLTSKVCLSDGSTIGDRKDMILALDRSQGIQSIDSSHRKVGADNISTTRYILEKLIDEAKQNPERAPKVGLMMFSTAPDCQEYDGSAIVVNREFPCLYVKAATIADEAHGARLLAFLKQAEGKYSQGGSSNSDLTIVGALLAAGTVGLNGPEKAGLVLFSDGRSFKGEAGDPFAYLKSTNYVSAQAEAVSTFGASSVEKYDMVFALNPVETPMYSAANHADTFSTMCEATGAPGIDCDQGAVNYADAKTWPVNKLDLALFARNLVEATGAPASSVVTVNAKQDIEIGLEALRVTAGTFAAIEAVTYTVDGGAPQQGSVNGGRIGVENLPTGAFQLELTLKSGGNELKIPIAIVANEVDPDGKDFSDAEMFCSAVETETEEPKFNLDNLQGGSASCGVVAEAKGATPFSLFFTILFPLGVAFAFAGDRFRRASLVLVAATFLSPITAKAEQAGGLNALQYSPVVDGVGMTEKATTINQGTYNFGLFMDYANDPVEIGGDKNERINSVMDNLVTAHAVGNVGLFKNISLGLHVPYVHNSDEERDVEGDDVSGGQVGRPADASINFKINFVRKDKISFGVMPIVTLPTGDSELLLGDGSTNYGGLFLLSGISGQFTWAFDTGYLHREKALELKDERTNSVTVTGQFLNHAGVEYRYSPLFSFGGNLQAKFTSGEHIDFTRSNPAEWMAMAKLRPAAGLDLEAGFGTGIGKGYGSPDYRVFAGLTYVPDATKRYAVTPIRKPAPAKTSAAVKRATARR